jgi:hypothetical protein
LSFESVLKILLLALEQLDFCLLTVRDFRGKQAMKQ